jgi:hypothetical protein
MAVARRLIRELSYDHDVSGTGSVMFRISYARYGELRNDVTQQMARGGLLVRVSAADGLALDTPVALELVLPDGRSLRGAAKVIQVLAGFGIAVSVNPALIEEARRAANGVDAAGASPSRHERIEPARSAGKPAPNASALPGAPLARSSSPRVPAPPIAPPAATAPTPASGVPIKADGPTRAEKIQKALHGTRDERNAILRDRDRTLHAFVLKNPQLNADDVVTIAKNAQMTPDLLKQIGERKDWFQRPAIALALARNPKTPPELAVRALDHVPLDILRQMAKGAGVLPHVTQAARKKLLG